MISDLQNLLVERLESMGIPDVVPTVTVSDDPTHGDYATNIAFVLAKKLQTNPMDAASKLANSLAEDMPPSLEKVEVAKPGFINLTLNKAYLIDQLRSRLDGTELPLKAAKFADRKIMIEFTDPNPFKEFHIGHLYDNIIGESLSRLLERVGGEVRRVTYQGDVGLHVAKSLWGMERKLQAEGLTVDQLAERPLDELAKFLGQAYALGATKYDEDEQAKQEIIELNKKVYQQDESIREMYTKGRQWSLEYFDTIYARLGSKFWKNYFESEAGPVGLDLVKEYLDKGVFKESEGAVVFPGEDHGLHTRVFINSLGLPTYEAKELGLAPTKYRDYPYDLSLIVTGNEINEYFKVLLKALSIIRPDLAEKTQHLSHGMVRLPEGKMSSRTGNVRTGEWLLNEAVSRAKDKIEEVKGEGSSRVESEQENEVTEVVGVAAVKWALLRSSIGKDVEFSFEESVSFEGNSGPYLQYTYVRAQSVLHKAEAQNSKFENLGLLATDYQLQSEERALLVYLIRYNDIIIEAADRYSPNIICTYLFELAQLFNLFYQKHPILKEEGSMRDFRLALTQAVGLTLKDGLHLLGITSPERM